MEKHSFSGYVVGIGASAGGLDALERFFKACPIDSGAAFVVIQHLSPDHKSMMNNLLSRHTSMQVILVEDDMPLEADKVFLIPPGTLLHVEDGHLRLTPKQGKGLALPIDIFFTSLAAGYQQKAIGVVLSGTGSDGSRGIVAISAGGGLTLIQSPATAKFDGMPKSALATGVIDLSLPVEELPARIHAHINNLLVTAGKQEPHHPYALKTESEILSAIIQLLHQAGGIDFSDYKPATVLRRIDRRMQLHHLPTMQQYLAMLDADHPETLALKREMLISVTSFFRDPEVFEELEQTVIEPLVSELPAGDSIRIWTAGCATGEEAYTVAILFLEAFERHGKWPALKIFATDVDQNCIDVAGAGKYSESAATEMSPGRLSKYFLAQDGYYTVKPELRQCIVFARHNLLADPPFTRMDLVVCRNTLIYFKAAAQERVIRSLQYAVRDGGVLLLGTSETLSNAGDGMQVLSVKHKLFRRTGSLALPFVDRRGVIFQQPKARAPGVHHHSRSRQGFHGVSDLGLAKLLEHYAPPALIVDENHQIVHLFGNAKDYLSARPGVASLDLSRQLLDVLVPVASALLYKVAREKVHLQSDLIHLTTTQGLPRKLCLTVHPLAPSSDEEDKRLFLLCFEDAGPTQEVVDSINVDAETIARVSMLERELAATRESLQATIEELETSNEELQATNEELMASNEELQSSNEELQSVNEEMSTVNAEFQEKVLILNRTNADLDSMSKAAGLATIFVDADVQLTRYSPDAIQLFRLREGDIGRPLDEIKHSLNYPNLIDDLVQTLKSERMIEKEICSSDERRIYLVRLLPYQVPSTLFKGAVATFVDMTSFHDAKKMQEIIDALPEHIAVLDVDGSISMVNSAWKRFAQANGDSKLARTGLGVNYLNACKSDGGCGYAAQAYRGIKSVLDGTAASFVMEYPCHSPDEKRWFKMTVSAGHGHRIGAVVSHVNITAWINRSDSDAPPRQS